MYGLGTDYTDQDLAKSVQLLHGYAASLGDSKQRYLQTGDARYLDAVNAVLPVFRQALSNAQVIASALNAQDQVSPFMVTLTDFSDWALAQAQTTVEGVTGTVGAVPKLVGALGSPLVLIAIAAVAFLALGGGKLFPKRS